MKYTIADAVSDAAPPSLSVDAQDIEEVKLHVALVVKNLGIQFPDWTDWVPLHSFSRLRRYAKPPT